MLLRPSELDLTIFEDMAKNRLQDMEPKSDGEWPALCWLKDHYGHVSEVGNLDVMLDHPLGRIAAVEAVIPGLIVQTRAAMLAFAFPVDTSAVSLVVVSGFDLRATRAAIHHEPGEKAWLEPFMPSQHEDLHKVESLSPVLRKFGDSLAFVAATKSFHDQMERMAPGDDKIKWN